MKSLFLLTILLFISNQIFSQTDTTGVGVELLERYLEESTQDESNSEIFDLIESLLDNPVNVNEASLNELLQIPFFDPKSARLVVDFRNSNGNFTSIYELKSIPNFSSDIYEKVKYFITVGNVIKKIDVPIDEIPNWLKNISLSLRSRIQYDVRERRGFEENIYEGSRIKSYNRIKLNYGQNYSGGFLAEKDAGEKSYTDHYSFFIEARNVGFENRILVGDYSIEFGQGLILWGPYSFSKGADAVNPIIRRERNFRGYTSADENQFFRGFAASTSIGDAAVSFYASQNKIDANLDENQLITSLPIDGFHRTLSEMGKIETVTEKMVGARFDYSINQIVNFGFLYSHTEFSNSFLKEDIFDISGKSFNYFSGSYNFFIKNLYFVGETAYNGTSVATINTLEITPTNKLAFIVSLRSYPKNFRAIHANALGERSNTNNEIGIYTGLKWRNSLGRFDFYYDQFKFPYALSNIPIPSKGNEFLVNYSTSPFKKIKFEARYKNEKKEDIELVEENDIIFNRKKHNFRLEVRVNLFDNTSFRTRGEYVKVDNSGILSSESGYLIFQDIKFRPIKSLDFYARLVYFETDSYASRLYQFENDLTGIMNNPALYGKGYRAYFMVRYEIINQLILSFKYSFTNKPDLDTMGSGLAEIQSSYDDRVNFQLDFRL